MISPECECDGDGFLECDLGYEHDCKDCDGAGTVGDPIHDCATTTATSSPSST